jgi:hypothetical protein
MHPVKAEYRLVLPVRTNRIRYRLHEARPRAVETCIQTFRLTERAIHDNRFATQNIRVAKNSFGLCDFQAPRPLNFSEERHL